MSNAMNMVEAINLALQHEMEANDKVVVFGEDVGVNGGVFRATQGLQEQFGEWRVRDTPISEVLIGSMAFGMAVAGYIPVAEIQFSGFMYANIDMLYNHAGRIRNRTRSRLHCPMVMRSPSGGGIHAPEHHSESPEGMLAHIPGIKVVYPSSPTRAYRLLLAAMRDPDPVIFLEPTRLYRLFKQELSADLQALPLGKAFVEQEGSDVTVVSWGAMMHECRQAVAQLVESGVSVELIDLATLKPMDTTSVLKSVEKTGRCVIVQEAPLTGGFGGEVAALIAEHSIMSLHGPVKRVAGYDTVMPLAQMEKSYIPSVEDIVRAISEVLDY